MLTAGVKLTAGCRSCRPQKIIVNIKDKTASPVINGDVDNLEHARTATDFQDVQRGHLQEK